MRAGLTALAVVLGVMMISGTYVFTDTINHSFDRIFQTANKGIALKVVPHKNVDSQEVAAPPFDQSLLAKVKATKGVAVAAGGVNDSATIFDDNGKRANKGQAPSLLFSATPRPFTPLRYSEGLPPSGPNDVTIDANTAKRMHWEVGDIVRVGAKAPVKRYRISGIGKFGDVSSFGGATIVVPTLREAQRITDKRGKLDEIDIAARAQAQRSAPSRRNCGEHCPRRWTSGRAPRTHRSSPTTSTAASASSTSCCLRSPA